MAHRRRAEPATPPDKTCASCGRRIEWRRKWEDSWDDVRYCSTACRRHGVTAQDRELEQRMLALMAAGPISAGVSPEEVARAVGPDEESSAALLEQARRAARRLVASGAAVMVQGGTVVDPSTAKGPVTLRRP